MNNIERKADVAIEKARFLEEQMTKQEKALLDFALNNTKLSNDVDNRIHGFNLEQEPQEPVTLIAFKKLMKYLIETPKIYYPERFVEYFSMVLSSLTNEGLFADFAYPTYIFQSFYSPYYIDTAMAIGKKIFNNEDIDTQSFNTKKIENHAKYCLNTNDTNKLKMNGDLNLILSHFIYYYLPLLLTKCPKVDLKPFFDESFKIIDEHRLVLKKGILNHGYLLYLVECVRTYGKYLPVGAKKKISNIILNQYKIDMGITKYCSDAMYCSDATSYTKIYPFRVYRKKHIDVYQTYGVYNDYMDLFLKNPLKILNNKETLNVDDENAKIIFENALSGVEYAYIAFLYCSMCDVENASEYIDLVITLDCPVVAYHFIQRLCNKLSRSDISKIMSMLKEESPSLYLKALDILEKKITEKDSQTQVIDEPSEETHNNEISPELAQTLAAIDILLKNNPELVTSDMEKLYKTFNQDLERDAYALLDYINNLTKQRTDSSTSKANYSRNLKKRKKKR